MLCDIALCDQCLLPEKNYTYNNYSTGNWYKWLCMFVALSDKNITVL